MNLLTLNDGLLSGLGLPPGLDPDDFCSKELCEMAQKYIKQVSLCVYTILYSYVHVYSTMHVPILFFPPCLVVFISPLALFVPSFTPFDPFFVCCCLWK